MPAIPVAVYIVFMAVIFLKDSLTEIFKTKESKIVGLIVIGYVLYSRVKASEDKANAETEAGTTPESALALRLHAAFNPYGYDWLGTDEDEILNIARAIGTPAMLKKVAAIYETLYGEVLATRLADEDAETAAQFYEIIRTGGTTTTPGTGTGGTSSGVQSAAGIRPGDTVAAIGDRYNLRKYSDPNTVYRKTRTGEKFEVLKMQNKTIAGTTGVWLHLKESTWGITFMGYEYWAFISGFKKV